MQLFKDAFPVTLCLHPPCQLQGGGSCNLSHIFDSCQRQANHKDPICAGISCYLTKDTPMYLKDSLAVGEETCTTSSASK